MKKFLILASLAFGMSLNGGAQLVVHENGQTQLGIPPSGISVNPAATLNICGINSNANANNNGGIISFGEGYDAMIGGSGALGELRFRAKERISLLAGNGTEVFSYTYQSKLFNFAHPVSAPSLLTTSDARYKKNVSILKEV